MDNIHYFDTHAHPDHPLIQMNPEYRERFFSEMRSAGVTRLVVAPISYESNFSSTELFPKEEYPEVFFAKGLHPKAAFNEPLWTGRKLADFQELLKNERVVALKTGLDFCKTKLQEHQKKREYEFLEFFLNMAEETEKPVVLHIREAAKEALEFFAKKKPKTDCCIHCFSYGPDVMEQFIDAGIGYFGIGGMMTRSTMPMLQEAVRELPLSRILLETDSPFVRVEGDTTEVNMPGKALPIVAEKIAELKGIPVEEVVQQTYENACRFYRLWHLN